jgi:hypothetical protein
VPGSSADKSERWTLREGSRHSPLPTFVSFISRISAWSLQWISVKSHFQQVGDKRKYLEICQNILRFFFFFWQHRGLNSGPHICQAGALPLGSLHQPSFVGFFWDRVLRIICPWLALNHHPPDLCLLSSWDYRREPPHLAQTILFFIGPALRTNYFTQA